jgi:hypothetical protein
VVPSCSDGSAAHHVGNTERIVVTSSLNEISANIKMIKSKKSPFKKRKTKIFTNKLRNMLVVCGGGVTLPPHTPPAGIWPDI